jgi:hypothetical protein
MYTGLLGKKSNKKKKKAKSSKKEPKDAIKTKENPILAYGFGIDIYLKMMFNLAILFTIFTAISYPVTSIYMSGNYYEDVAKAAGGDGALLGLEKMSMGNLGYSE